VPSDKERNGIWRKSLSIMAVALIGAAVGGAAGYLAGATAIRKHNPFFYLQGSSGDKPIDEVYRAWVRLGALDAANEGCAGQPISAAALKREEEVIDALDARSKKLSLNPPLDLARAIVSYRTAMASESRSDERTRREAILKELTQLRAAGWREPTHDKVASMIRGWDGGCEPGSIDSKEAK